MAAALPGGDPLAAALAAGETPSPEMVVAAGEGEGLAPKFARPAVRRDPGEHRRVLRHGHPAQRPRSRRATLFARCAAREGTRPAAETRLLGRPYDDAAILSWYGEFFDWVNAHDKPLPDWRRVFAQEPALLRFSYRTSPGPMTAAEFHTDLLTPGIVTAGDPRLRPPA